MRADVLAVLSTRQTPVSAYDVLRALRPGKPKIALTTVHRALATLVDRGFVHRLESSNAYIACQCEEHGEAPILPVRKTCGSVAETVSTEILNKLSTIARNLGIARRGTLSRYTESARPEIRARTTYDG
ncbi:MAG: transcriptional repressor [Gammaproteobacteria bacterium]|nr:transcriptional repressor [Gammaproteobacteria bacterium]